MLDVHPPLANASRLQRAATALAFILLLFSTCRIPAQSTASQTLKVDGVDRTYLVHLPTGYLADKPLPLLLVLHGMDVTAELAAQISGLDRWANKTGFIAVYPQGLEKRWHTGTVDATIPPAEAAKSAAAIRNDFDFIAALIAKIEGTYAVDRGRVSVAGMSNGGGFAQELACSPDLRFQFVVSVSGPIQPESAKGCAPKHPVRFISLHGTADPIVPYPGGRVAVPGGGPIVLPVADDLLLWARINGCALEPATEKLPDRPSAPADDTTHIERITFKGCTPGGEVTHYRILGGGHTWPGAAGQPSFLGTTTQQIDASELIADLISGTSKN